MLFVPCFYTGACGVAVGYPFDTVKVCLLQNHFHLRQSSVSRKSFTELDALCLCVCVCTSQVRIQTQKQFTGIWQCFVKTLEKEGVRCFIFS